MWGFDTYYAKVDMVSSPTGAGSVYVGNEASPTQNQFEFSSSSKDKDMAGYIKAENNDGYHFSFWSGENVQFNSTTSAETTITVKTGNDNDSDGRKYYTITANFEENYYVEVNTSVNISDYGKAYVALGSPFSGNATSAANTGTGGKQTTGEEETFSIKAEPTVNCHFVSWSADGVNIVNPSNSETIIGVTGSADSQGKDNPAKYKVTANFDRNVYYAKVDLSKNGEGTATIDDASSSTKSSTVSGEVQTFTLSASSTVQGWHFAQWNKISGDGLFDNNTAKSTYYKAKVASTGVHEATAEYEIEAKFVENYYTAVSTAVSTDEGAGGSAYIAYGAGSTVGTETSANDGYGQEYARDVYYQIKAVANAGYHFAGWTIDDGVVENPDFLESKITVKSVNECQGPENKKNYKVTAHFEKDRYYAKLNTRVSPAKEGSKAGSAQVKTGDGESDWADSHTKSADSPNTPVEFEVKATPKAGYQFIGWAKDETSTTDLLAGNTYSVNSSSVQGGTNEETIYAVFDKGKYKVHFLPNQKPGRPVTNQDSMPDVEFTSGVDETLPKNQFVCHVSVTYDAQGGTSDKPFEKRDRFSRWKEWVGGEVKNAYNDGGVINRMEVHNNTVNLQATWKDTVGFYLPNATREHHGQPQTFLGWFDSAEGGNFIGGAGTKVTIGENEKTLYAHWGVCDIKITTVSSSYTTGDNVVFAVDRIDDKGGEKYHSRISVPIGGSKILKDVPMGTYKIVAEDKWSWNYTSSEVDSKEVSSGLTEFSFTVNSKSSPKKHDETSKTKGYDTTN